MLGAMLLGHLAQVFLPFEQRHWLEITFALWMFSGGEFLPERAYSLLSYAFLHGDWMHLLFNALWIAILGSKLHEALGTRRFLLLFVVSTAVAGLVQVASGWGETTLTIGASGFVYALVACMAYLFVLHPTDSPAERRRKLVVFTIAIAAINVAFAYAAGGFVTAGDIAWQAHAGGFLAGLALYPPLARSALRARRGGAN
ncbi:rhomboid family intramembrane serine protease [Algihabitans albus]|uniref:rhomboid family intramembrane serine protease n=1 Tax=Algihabitans albus TaxID=2164067 RepID=UPI0013C2B886|nr:rhomboid family intramembrane serine protease [Algihabitans albus]